MASSDGFSIKTTIAQVGQVARSQVKAQQAAPAATPHGAEKIKKENRPDKVKKPEETEKSRIDPDHRDRRHDRQRGERDRDDAQQENEREPVGHRLDTKA